MQGDINESFWQAQEEAFDPSGKVREGSHERGHSSVSPTFFPLGTTFPAEGPGRSQARCPAPFSCRSRSYWFREGPTLSSAEISPRDPVRKRNCLLPLNSGC